MAIDHVHDLQFVFRKILDSMANPGEVTSLEKLTGQSKYNLQSYEATILTMLALFDGEVTFHVLPHDEGNITEKIAAYTLAIPTTMEKADFIIALQGTKETVMKEAFAACKKGSLIDPHTSATWLIETECMQQQKQEVNLTGPGIKHERRLDTTLTANLWQARNDTVSEYPMGIDLIFTDQYLQITAVPRTTKVEMVEVD